MENFIKDIEDIMFDVERLEARTCQYADDIDRGINANHTAAAEGEPRLKTIENLFSYLIDAKHDMDRVQGSLKEIQDKLDKLFDMADYEAVARKIRK